MVNKIIKKEASENVRETAKDIISEDRVKILNAHHNRIRALVRGRTDTYRVNILIDGRFSCGCNAYIYRGGRVICSHVEAVRMHEIYKMWMKAIRKAGDY